MPVVGEIEWVRRGERQFEICGDRRREDSDWEEIDEAGEL